MDGPPEAQADPAPEPQAAPAAGPDRIGLEALAAMADRASLVVDRLRDRVFAPDTAKRLEVTFSVKRAAEMVGRSEKLIRDAEADGRLPAPEKNPETGRRTGYSLAEVNEMRRVLGTLPWRGADDPALVLAVQSFKGGVGKTSLTCHLAQYLALQGYRVCVIDCDSQASATSIFGLNPDADVDEERETLYPFFRHGGPATLDYALRETYWPGIALIPANLGLYDAEYEFAARIARESGRVLDRLRAGIDTIKDRFDVILMDPPPGARHDLAERPARGRCAADPGPAQQHRLRLDRAFPAHDGLDAGRALRKRGAAGLPFRQDRHHQAQRDQGRPCRDQADDGQRVRRRHAAPRCCATVPRSTMRRRT